MLPILLTGSTNRPAPKHKNYPYSYWKKILAFLSWSHAKCNQLVFLLSKIRRYVSPQVAVQIYKAIIMSRLSYGGLLYIGAAKPLLSWLQKLQNRALRICFGADRYTSNLRLHRDSNILPLQLRRKLDVYKVMYNRMLNLSRSVESEVEGRPATRYALSRPPDMVRPRSEKFLKSVVYQGPKLWADLPPQMKTLNELPTFDREIRKIIKIEFDGLTSI